ncbi:MAG: hypothetical protein ACWGPN_17930, partial [Gammaproteobacteria bacterium]
MADNGMLVRISVPVGSQPKNRGVHMHRLVALLFLGVTSAPLQAQWFDWQSPHVPRTADGRPDLSAPVPTTPDGGVDL